jgi:uncharacterized membrane protein HdeD (DUF308 family)
MSTNAGNSLPSHHSLSPHWGWIALRGVAAIVFGVLALILPGIALGALVLMWGAYAIVDGVLALVSAFRLRDEGAVRWPLVIVGLLGIVAGVVTFVWPGLTALALLFIIAAWALLVGVFQIVAAIRFRKVLDREWLLILSGLVSVVFGVLMIASPGAGALAVIWLIAAYSIVFGVLLVLFSLRLRRTAN